MTKYSGAVAGFIFILLALGLMRIAGAQQNIHTEFTYLLWTYGIGGGLYTVYTLFRKT